jgi:hypothetical protein
MIGNFQGEGMPGKMQFGSGWWFNDQKDGMERQMTAGAARSAEPLCRHADLTAAASCPIPVTNISVAFCAR